MKSALVIGSFALNLAGIWWGLPSEWAGDEMTPKAVLVGLSQHFTGGWFDRYPPLHFYILSAVFSPLLWLKSLGWINVSDVSEIWGLFLASRLVSVIAGAGTLMAAYVCGTHLRSKRAGLFAAATFALLTPFLYYAKTANPEVPYVFWFAVSLVFYMRLVRKPTLKDAALFSATAVLAICTKDQAYALYLSVPFVIVYQAWRSNRDQRLSHPALRAVFANGPLTLAAVVGLLVLVVCYQIPFNTAGFIEHVRDITGPGSQPYRSVAPTLGGRLALLRVTAGLDQMSWGWPMYLLSAIGLIAAVQDSSTRRGSICLVLVAAGYYAGFINMILYVYDRYLLPICLVQAIFAGIAFDRFLRSPSGGPPAWRTALVGTIFGYTLLYATTVDVLMVRDSRYTVEQWLRTHAGSDRLIGTTFPLYVLPRLAGLHSEEIGTVDDLLREAPSYYVLNADYAHAVPADTGTGQLIAGLQHETLGYRLVFRYRAPVPWPWLPAAHHDLVGPRLESRVYSVLRNINPTIEVYSRENGGAERNHTAP